MGFNDVSTTGGISSIHATERATEENDEVQKLEGEKGQ